MLSLHLSSDLVCSHIGFCICIWKWWLYRYLELFFCIALAYPESALLFPASPVSLNSKLHLFNSTRPLSTVCILYIYTLIVEFASRLKAVSLVGLTFFVSLHSRIPLQCYSLPNVWMYLVQFSNYLCWKGKCGRFYYNITRVEVT